ncbi:MAG: hypothetical protein RXQ75_08725 [Acidianus hospitalis]
MSEEAIARALASNEDFARKVADLIADKIVIKKIDELTKEVGKTFKNNARPCRSTEIGMGKI